MASPKGIWKVITASSVGTLIEWYDFYIFGSLSTIIAAKFFPAENPTAALLSTLATFAAGFIVRPFGALVFGRLGCCKALPWVVSMAVPPRMLPSMRLPTGEASLQAGSRQQQHWAFFFRWVLSFPFAGLLG
jgi:hypothetical protein